LPPAGLRHLTVEEYRSSVRDLIGVEPPDVTSFEPDAALGAFTSTGAVRIALSARHVERYETLAHELASRAFGDDARRRALVGCHPAGAADPCLTKFLAGFTRRAFRRPPTDAELAPYRALVERLAAAGDVWRAVSYAVAAVLQSPHFLYRSELGEADPAVPGRRRLTGYELATRLSYLVTGSTPDEELLLAAERGALATPEGLRAAADRLLTTPKAATALKRFFAEHLHLPAVATVTKDAKAFPRFSPDLARSMAEELDRVVSDLVFKKGADLGTLLVTRETFVDRALAEHYGLPVRPAAGRWEAVSFPEGGPRAGLLAFGGLLSLHAAPVETSPTKRGHFITGELLCRSIPAPPEGVDTTLPPSESGARRTMRERVEKHMEDPNCRGCHALMDPLGLALEQFDAVGVHRTMDAGKLIDVRGDLDGQPFEGARALGERLREHPEVRACLVRRFHEFALGAAADGAALPVQALVAAVEQRGGGFGPLLQGLVASDMFRFSSAPR
jgi:hypothetical protein